VLADERQEIATAALRVPALGLLTLCGQSPTEARRWPATFARVKVPSEPSCALAGGAAKGARLRFPGPPAAGQTPSIQGWRTESDRDSAASKLLPKWGLRGPGPTLYLSTSPVRPGYAGGIWQSKWVMERADRCITR